MDLIGNLEVENLGNARMMNILGNNFSKISDYIYLDILVYSVLSLLDYVRGENQGLCLACSECSFT